MNLIKEKSTEKNMNSKIIEIGKEILNNQPNSIPTTNNSSKFNKQSSSLNSKPPANKNKKDSKTLLCKPYLLEFIGKSEKKSMEKTKILETKKSIEFNKEKIAKIGSQYYSNTNPSNSQNKTATKIINYKKYIPLNLKLSSKVSSIQNSILNKETHTGGANHINTEGETNYINYLNTDSNQKTISNNYGMSTNKMRMKKNSHPLSLCNTPKTKLTMTSLIKKEKTLASQNSIINQKVISPNSPIKTQNLTRSNSNVEALKYNASLDKEQIFSKFGNILKKREIEEIKSMEEVYFMGYLATTQQEGHSASVMSNRVKNSRPETSCEFNDNSPPENEEEEEKYDDENGNYIINLGDHINYRYEIISELGRGSFGQAIKCFDHKTKERVCIKIIKNKKKFNKQAKIEISILEYIKKNDKLSEKEETNIVRVIDHFIFRNHIVSISFLFYFF